MVEIDYKTLEAPLAETMAASGQVYLIHGDEMLIKEAYRAVLDVLLPEADRSLDFEPLDGAETAMEEVVERMNTYSLMAGTKVVALTDARLFLSGRDRAGLLNKAREQVEEGDADAGARHLVAALAISGLTFDDLAGADRTDSLKRLGVDPADAEWLDRLAEHCREKRFRIPADQDADAVLQQAVEKGFPPANHLIVTTAQVDRRRRLYGVFKEQGTVIDCSVPKGDRHADRKVQEAVARRQMTAILEGAGKTIAPDAARRLFEMVGYDLRTVATSVEKLIDYSASRPQIGEEDVGRLLQRTKKDPIFEFTNALTDRDLDGALFFLNSLLDGGVLAHPLQLLGAAANQLRKLILLKAFTQSPEAGHWHAQMSFGAFKGRVLPALQANDGHLVERIARWGAGTVPVEAENKGSAKKKASGKGKGGKAVKTDLRMVANPKNAYPVYQMMKKTEHFSMRELTEGLREIARCDLRIKTGGKDPRLILEKALIAICVVDEEAGRKGALKTLRFVNK